MLIKKRDDVPLQDVTMDGARDVKVRVVFGPDDKAPTFAMRIFELAPGGHTPFHTHPFEHEAVVLEGDIAAVSESGETPLDQGDMLLIAADETHQFKNRSKTNPASFMCLVPIQYQK